MRVWGLCRKPKCPRPPVTHLPLSCSLGEAGGAGAEPPQNLPTAAAVVQTVLPLKWSGRKRGTGLSNPVPRFRRRNGNGKNPDSQGGQSGDFLRSKKYYSALTVWIGGTDMIADCLRRKNLLYLGKQIKRKFLRKHNSVKKFLKWKERSIK